MSVMIGEIAIPADDQGFVLLQCSLCGEFFKLHPEDYGADDVIDICCPSCGLTSEEYLTDDVIELVNRKVMNFANGLIYDRMKRWEKQLNGNLSFKVGAKPKNKEEHPVKYGIDNLEMVKYPCCNREAKIKPIYRMCGSYCPFCGVRYEENR